MLSKLRTARSCLHDWSHGENIADQHDFMLDQRFSELYFHSLLPLCIIVCELLASFIPTAEGMHFICVCDGSGFGICAGMCVNGLPPYAVAVARVLTLTPCHVMLCMWRHPGDTPPVHQANTLYGWSPLSSICRGEPWERLCTFGISPPAQSSLWRQGHFCLGTGVGYGVLRQGSCKSSFESWQFLRYGCSRK